MSEYFHAIHITMGWVMFIFLVWFIKIGIDRWAIFPIIEYYVDKNYKQIFSRSRIIPINQSTDSLVASFKRMIKVRRREHERSNCRNRNQ